MTNKQAILPLLSASVWLLAAGLAQAGEYTVRDGDTLNAKLSRDGLTRLSILGARVEQVFSADGQDLTFQVDKRNGQVFVRYKSAETLLDEISLPAGGSVKRKQAAGSGKDVFSAFVTDDGGRTFNLNLTLAQTPSESIVLKPLVVEKAKSGRVIIQNDQALPAEVMALTQVMAQNATDVSGYEVARDLHEPQAWWGGTEYVRVASYAGDTLLGETYTLTNRSGAEMRMVESEFQAKGVLGVAIKTPILQDGEFTTLYIVREADQ